MKFTFLGVQGIKNWISLVISALTPRSSGSLVFRQLFEATSSTYSYLLGDSVSKECVLIDPVLETVERDSALMKQLGFTLKFCLNTHVHADHVTGSGELKKLFPDCQSVLSKYSGGKADLCVDEFDTLTFGNHFLYVLRTPGHTDGCISFILNDKSRCFTGDALLIRACGRTDFQSGSAALLFESIHSKIFNLPDSTLIYPAHDYKGNMCSSVYEERTFNPRLTKTKDEFITIMNNLNLPRPKQIDIAVPLNLSDGLKTE